MGKGDATFRALADRFLNQSLACVSGEVEALRIFTIYGVLQAKNSIPGVGGNTRIWTLSNKGELTSEKSGTVIEIQDFFRSFDTPIHLGISGNTISTPEAFLDFLNQNLKDELGELKTRLDKIQKDRFQF